MTPSNFLAGVFVALLTGLIWGFLGSRVESAETTDKLALAIWRGVIAASVMFGILTGSTAREFQAMPIAFTLPRMRERIRNSLLAFGAVPVLLALPVLLTIHSPAEALAGAATAFGFFTIVAVMTGGTLHSAVNWGLLALLGFALLRAHSVQLLVTAHPWLVLLACAATAFALLRRELDVAGARAQVVWTWQASEGVIAPRAKGLGRLFRDASNTKPWTRKMSQGGTLAFLAAANMERGGLRGLVVLSLLLIIFNFVGAFLVGELRGAVVLSSLLPFLMVNQTLRAVPVLPPRRARWALSLSFAAAAALAFSLCLLVSLFVVQLAVVRGDLIPSLQDTDFAALRWQLLGMLIAMPVTRAALTKFFRSEFDWLKLKAKPLRSILLFYLILSIYCASAIAAELLLRHLYESSGGLAFVAAAGLLGLSCLLWVRVLRRHFATADLI